MLQDQHRVDWLAAGGIVGHGNCCDGSRRIAGNDAHRAELETLLNLSTAATPVLPEHCQQPPGAVPSRRHTGFAAHRSRSPVCQDLSDTPDERVLAVKMFAARTGCDSPRRWSHVDPGGTGVRECSVSLREALEVGPVVASGVESDLPSSMRRAPNLRMSSFRTHRRPRLTDAAAGYRHPARR